jgi:hypothetical protein
MREREGERGRERERGIDIMSIICMYEWGSGDDG